MISFVVVLSVSAAIVAVVVNSFLLPYPIWFYLPALVRNVVNPTLPNQPVDWLSNLNKNDFKLSKADGPNILLIIADDLGVNDISGGAGVPTPNIDSIKSNGVHFIKGYSGHGTCAPARASVMTGRYATRFGFEFTPVPKQFAWILSAPERQVARQAVLHKDKFKETPLMREMVVPTSETMISEILADEGYRNYYVGKWHLGETDGHRPAERGFHESLSFLKGASLYSRFNNVEVVSAESPIPMGKFLEYNLEFAVSYNNGKYFEPDAYMTDYLSKEASKAIETHVSVFKDSKKPFFMTLAYNAPHDPFQALKSDYESEEVNHIKDHTKRVYAAMIKALDRGVGQVIQTLKDTNQYENTVIIFTSDNGAANYLGLKESNKPFRGGKATLFEGGIRVPYLMQWPKKYPEGLVYEHPVSHVDIYATIASVAGLKAHKNPTRSLDGRDLTPFLQLPSPNDGPSPHSSLFWRSSHYRALIAGEWKIQVAENPDKIWLYNLADDPTERVNLAEGIKLSSFVELNHPFGSPTVLRFPETLELVMSSGDITIHHIAEADLKSYVDNEPVNIGWANHTYNSGEAPSYNTVSTLKQLLTILFSIDDQQIKPLWPSLVEVPMSIDKSRLDVFTLEDEYVYWAN